MLLYEKETFEIRGCIYNIYKEFRNYHKEIVYHNSLANDLEKKGFDVARNKRVTICHNGTKVGTYIPDLIVNGKIMIEIKCKPRILMQDRKQFWHYLKTAGYRLGLLVNFGVENGVQIERKIFDFKQPHSA